MCLMPSLKEILDSCMRRVSGLDVYCSRCLRIERWGGCVVLMVVDAAFTSIGLNYFTAVVPKVVEFSKKFVENGRSSHRLSRPRLGRPLEAGGRLLGRGFSAHSLLPPPG